MDYIALLGALREIDYQGTLVLEPVPPGSDPILLSQFSENLPLRDIYAEESINYLRQIEQAL